MKNGKVLAFLKAKWHYFAFIASFFVGFLCGCWYGKRTTTVTLDANRTPVVVQFNNSKIKN